MKRFPVEKDREFEIAGEVFTWVYPYWEDIAAVFDKDDEEDANGEVAAISVRETISDFIQRIELFIEPTERERWSALTKRKKNPIPHSQYAELYRWLLETTSAPTPTESPVPLANGPQADESTSTGGSS